MTTRSLAPLLALGLAALASPAPAASPLAVMPFTYVGRIVDSTHTAFDGTTAVELRLKDLSGRLLAKCTTYTSETSPYNYRLDVPMATAPAEGCATYGQVVAIELVDANGVLWAGLFPASKCAVGKPGDLCRCDIVVAADANANGIADEYEDYLAWRMWNNGVEGTNNASKYNGGYGARYSATKGFVPLPSSQISLSAGAGEQYKFSQNEGWGSQFDFPGW